MQNFIKVIFFLAQESIHMNNIKEYEKTLKEICEKYEGAEDFFNKKLDEICS